MLVDIGPGQLPLMQEDIDGPFVPAVHHNIGESFNFFRIFGFKL
jgi:hypothetical protein